MDTLTNNIIGIAFMHKNKLHYDMQTRQVKIAGIEGDQIVAIKEQVLPALASTVVTAKFKGKLEPNVHFIASIFAPKNPMLSGMPAMVTVDKNNICKIVIENCAPYDVTMDRNDIIALMDRETEQLQPHLHHQLLRLLHHGTFGLQNKGGQCSAGSGAVTARLQLYRTSQPTTPVSTVRKICSLYTFHSHTSAV